MALFKVLGFDMLSIQLAMEREGKRGLGVQVSYKLGVSTHIWLVGQLNVFKPLSIQPGYLGVQGFF